MWDDSGFGFLCLIDFTSWLFLNLSTLLDITNLNYGKTLNVNKKDNGLLEFTDLNYILWKIPKYKNQ